MKRSSSASIVSDKRFVCSSSSSSSQSAIFRSSSVSSGLESEPYLPTFSPFSHAAEKKRRHLKLAKIFVHSIPFVVLFCAIVLWLFSDPETVLPIWNGKAKRIKHMFGPKSVYYSTEDEKLSVIVLA